MVAVVARRQTMMAFVMERNKGSVSHQSRGRSMMMLRKRKKNPLI